MGENTMNNNQAPETAGEGAKTFTQEDVNRIIGERLAKEKAANDAKLAQREQALTQRELLLTTKEKISSAGLPSELAEAINMTSAETVDKALEIIKKIIKDGKEVPEIKGVIPEKVPRFSTGFSGASGYERDAGIRDAMGLNR